MTAKEYLSRYREALIKADGIRDSISELRERQEQVGSPAYSDLPKVPGDGDLADYIARLDARERKLNDQLQLCAQICEEIEHTLDQLGKDYPTEAAMLRKRYIAGKAWEDIAKDMGYAERNVYVLHGKALLHVCDIIKIFFQNPPKNA